MTLSVGDRVTQTTLPGAVEASAVLSSCGLYRYSLTRRWADGPTLCWVMLNPSTADASDDDPTIRRVLGFSRREGFGAVEVVNCYAMRATNPRELGRATEPIGPENDRYILEAAARGQDLVCAWGAGSPLYARRPGEVLRKLEGLRRQLLCLGLTSTKQYPRHPLYVRGDQPFERLARSGLRLESSPVLSTHFRVPTLRSTREDP